MAIDKNIANTVDRAIDVLNIIAASRLGEFSASDLAEQMGMSRSSTYRLLLTLQGRNLLRTVGNGNYKLGLGVLAWSQKLLTDDGLVEAMTAVLERVTASTGETTYLGVLDGHRVLYVARVNSPHPVHMRSSVGVSNPLHSTALGKVLLAFSPPAEFATYCADIHLETRTKNTITSVDALAEEIDRVRAHRYATDDEENEEGIRCVAAPVVVADRAIAAVSVSSPAFRTPVEKLIKYAQTLNQEIAAATSVTRGTL